MGIFSSAAKAIKRGAKALAGKPLDFEEMSPLQKMDEENRINQIKKEKDTTIQKLQQRLHEGEQDRSKKIGMATAAGITTGVGGVLGTQAYLKNKARKDRLRRKLIREAIKTGNPQFLPKN